MSQLLHDQRPELWKMKHAERNAVTNLQVLQREWAEEEEAAAGAAIVAVDCELSLSKLLLSNSPTPSGQTAGRHGPDLERTGLSLSLVSSLELSVAFFSFHFYVLLRFVYASATYRKCQDVGFVVRLSLDSLVHLGSHLGLRQEVTAFLSLYSSLLHLSFSLLLFIYFFFLLVKSTAVVILYHLRFKPSSHRSFIHSNSPDPLQVFPSAPAAALQLRSKQASHVGRSWPLIGGARPRRNTPLWGLLFTESHWRVLVFTTSHNKPQTPPPHCTVVVHQSTAAAQCVLNFNARWQMEQLQVGAVC